MVGLAEFADRLASNLSGGQQQRVALARAIGPKPALLLLDEPLSNLDADLREQMREELQKLQQSLKMTTIYVTHDQIEALSLSHRIAVMRGGEIVEIGRPQDLYQRPQSAFSARFVGGANVLSGTARSANQTTQLQTRFGLLTVAEKTEDGERSFFVRPERIQLLGIAPDQTINSLTARVLNRRFIGEATEFDLDVGVEGTVLHARATDAPVAEVGSGVWVRIDPTDIHFLTRD